MAQAGVRAERQQLNSSNFANWLRFLLPTDEELGFARVGFYTTLWEAVLRGYREGKPILLWAMNGHPMACT